MSTPCTTSSGGVSPRRLRRVLATLIFTTLVSTVSASSPPTLPYVPTTILIPNPSLDESILTTRAYIFSPNPDSEAIDLLTLDLSRSIPASSNPELLAISSNSPAFLATTSFSPSILDNGTIVVITGGDSCSSSTNAATLYTYAASISSSASSPSHSGVWTSRPIVPAVATSWESSTSLNPYHLSTTLQFSSQLSPTPSPPVFYLYGGMCPYPNTSSSTWQNSATYSNRMLRISSDSMVLDRASSAGGPPVAEAGFTFTPLSPPSIANRSGIVTQQMSYVMIGGHTQEAWVNISTAAVWSLPEESWGFVSIGEDVGGGEPGKGDLVKDEVSATKVDSRSGHSAVLSEDGSRLVIFGGWVGHLGQKAEPQLAVVEIGVGFEDWRWRVPEVDGGDGVYGHGAVLLPGNVMMVYGGWEISADEKGKKKRQAEGQGVRFFNITDMSWQKEYSHPDLAAGSGTSNGGKGGGGGGGDEGKGEGEDTTHDESKSKNLGIGLGLGIGFPILIASVLFVVCFRRRRARRRAERDEALRGLAQGMPPPRQHSDEMSDRNDPNSGIGFFPWNASTAQEWYTGGHDPYDTASSGGRRRSLGYETLRGGGRSAGGLYIPPMPAAPSMTRPRGSVARGLYQPTTGSDRPLRSPNRIHPIYEDDEDDDLEDGGKHPLSPDLDDDRDDPFLTPTRDKGDGGGGALFPPPGIGGGSSSSGSGSRGSPSPEMVQVSSVLPGGPSTQPKQDAEVQGWVSDVDAADAMLTARISRHGSTTTTPPALKLAGGGNGNGNGNGPSTPTRGAGRSSPTRRASTRSSGKELDDARTGSNLSDRSAFSFAQGGERAHLRSTFGGGPGIGRSNSSSGSSAHTYSTAKSNFATMQAEGPSLLLGGSRGQEQHDEEDDYYTPGSPSKSKPRRSWFGSLRRVFSGATPSDGSSSRGDSPTRDSLLDGDSSSRLVGLGPGGVLLRRKQGREAWDSAEQHEEEEWDVEKAVEQRLVQIMFTVPKERLRVVNAEVERDEEMKAVVVDPGRESYVDSEGEDGDGGDEKGKGVVRPVLGLVPVPVPMPVPMPVVLSGSGEEEEDEEEAEAERRGKQTIDEKNLLAVHDHFMSQNQQEGTTSGVSPSTSMRSAATSTIHTAEAIRLERPRTRVLEMVESIEGKSRDGSPSGSPSR